jgi:hypothetical protein
VIHVYADAPPGAEFEPAEATLEDVYFASIHGHLRNGRATTPATTTGSGAPQ